MAKCTECDQEISCPRHEHSILPVMPCEAQSASIWVRAIDEDGASVPGLVAAASGSRATTVDNGFAKLADLAEGKHTVTLELDERAAALYLAPEPDARKETLKPGDLKLLAVKLRARVRPLLDLSAVAAHVGGRLTLILRTDRPYVGKGTLRCTEGADCIAFDPPRANDDVDFAGPVQLQVTLTKASARLDGIVFEWSLDPAWQRGAADVKAATAVTVTLEPHTKAGRLPVDAKIAAPGLVVHLQDAGGHRRRAEVELVVSPPAFVGEVELAAVGNGEVVLWTRDALGERLDLGLPVPVGPDHPTSYFLEGTKASQASGDVTVTAKLRGDPVVRDRFLVSVVRVTLTAYAGRDPTARDADPVAIPEDEKLDPGRTILRERGRHVQRAKLAVAKQPADVPCKLRLVAAQGGEAVGLFPAAEEVLVSAQRGERERLTFENVRELEAAPLDLIPGIDLDTIVVPEGWIFWLSGDRVTGPRGVQLRLDIEDVDEGCDAVAYTIIDPTLTIELTKTPNGALMGDVDVRVQEIDRNTVAVPGIIAAGGSSVAIPVPAGHYVVEIVPRHPGEKAMRVVRTEPASSAAAVEVLGPVTAKFELRPAYTHVQPISYWVYTGTPLGIDAAAADDPTRETNADADMQAKAALMQEAISAVRTAIPNEVDPSVTTLKIFMAPEFFFRGAQGAYPLCVLPKILEQLAGEIEQPAYEDWLFVLGTAVGVVDAPTPVTDPAKRVRGTITAASYVGPVPEFSGMASPNLSNVTLEVDFPDAARPAPGWAMTSPVQGTVVGVGVKPPDTPTVSVQLRSAQVPMSPLEVTALVNEMVAFEDPAEAEIVNVAIVRKGGTAVPTGADGRGLRELMIEKDYVAWADLSTPVDSGQGAFFESGHQLVSLFGQLCRAKPPEASFMAHRFNWPNPPPVNSSEINTSGSGGGSVFTIDRITFGLEICMDHGLGARLSRYYFRSGGPGAPAAVPGDPVPQVLLIPAGGMTIKPRNVVTVQGGVVFNVDNHGGPDAQVTTGPPDQAGTPMTAVAKRGAKILLPTDATSHFAVYTHPDWPGNGAVQCYASVPLPQPAWMP